MDDSEIERIATSLAQVTTVDEILALPPHTDAVMIAHMDDAKAAALASLHSLQILFTDGNNRISDAGLGCLVGLGALRSLDLEWSLVTDSGVLSLASLVSLEWLDLGGCDAVSEAAVQLLRQQLPACEIEYWGCNYGPRSN